MAATRTIEAHELDSQTGGWCDRCHAPSTVIVRCALVASDTLEMLGRYTGSLCTLCGHEDVSR
jgi:hypothetical protein